MDRFPWEVLTLAAVLALNRLAVPSVAARPALFWAIQAVNLGGGAAVIFFGVPGLGEYPVVGWLVAGLLAFHAVQNFATRGKVLHDAQRRTEEREIARMVREATQPDDEIKR